MCLFLLLFNCASELCFGMWCLFVCSSGFLRVCFFFKQKTAYEMRISDWSSDVCSSDLGGVLGEELDSDLTPVLHHDHRGRVHALRLRAAVGCQIGRASCRERVCQYV